MNTPDNLTILQQELSAGPRTGLELERAMDISGVTLSRLLVRMGGKIDWAGAARSTRYGLRRQVRNLADACLCLPLGRIRKCASSGICAHFMAPFVFSPRAAATAKQPHTQNGVCS